jgi:hypothetical protein
MVRSMDCLGTSTRPNKDPRNKANNAKFYTIPVKLAFNNKPMAKQVTDLLRRKYKLSTSIPYHKSLKASITLVYKKLVEEHPGYQVKVNLDTVNRRLRGSIRKPPTPDPETQKWTHLGKAYPLPPEALDTNSGIFPLNSPSRVALHWIPGTSYPLLRKWKQVRTQVSRHRSHWAASLSLQSLLPGLNR